LVQSFKVRVLVDQQKASQFFERLFFIEFLYIAGSIENFL
jgi:hypothetical protein